MYRHSQVLIRAWKINSLSGSSEEEKTFLMGADQPRGAAGVINVSPFWRTLLPSAHSLQLWLYPQADLQEKLAVVKREFKCICVPHRLLMRDLQLQSHIVLKVHKSSGLFFLCFVF